MELLDGKKVSQLTKDRLKEKVEILKQEGITPKLAVIMVGSDSASQIYVRNKSKACDYIGIKFEEHLLPEETKQEELLNLIEELNNKKEINGILLQSPIPRNLDINEAFRKISPEKDVDGFHPVNVGKLVLGQDTFISCTPFGIMKILEEYNIDIEGKNAVVIGRSNIVGKPVAMLLLCENGTVTICHSKTKNLAEITKNADILVAAIGKPCFVTEDMVKPGAIVIDVGINRMEDGKLKGDVDFETVNQKASYITPVPGGVGPMTIAMLMTNVVKAAENQSKN